MRLRSSHRDATVVHEMTPEGNSSSEHTRLFSLASISNFFSFLAASLASSRMLPRVLYTLLSLAIAFLLAACGDPGSGGSGIPNGAVVGTPTTGGVNASPQPDNGVANAPAPNVPVSLSALRVEVIESNAVVIGGVRYPSVQVDVFFADGSVGSFASLMVGQTISVSDSSPAAAVQRWRLTIQAQP
jgi:hypothetical protein